MKDEIKAARLAALFGITDALPAKISPREAERRTQVSREAEAVINFLQEPKGFLRRTCRHCKQDFAVNRANISLCSDSCRTEYLSEVFGLDVDYSARTPADRWRQNTGGPEPLIVPPVALAIVAPLSQQQETA